MLQQPIMGLVHKQGDILANLFLCDPVELLQAPGIALLRCHSGVLGQPLDGRRHSCSVKIPAVPGDKYRSGLDSLLTGIIQQLFAKWPR